MNKISKLLLLIGTLMLAAAMLIGCGALPELPTRTPQAEPTESVVETEATELVAEPEETTTESSGIAATEETEPVIVETAVEYVIVTMEAGAASKAVDLLGAWVEAGVPETDAFDYTGRDGDTYQGYYTVDIQPLFSNADIWFDGSRACDSCHFANNAASAHEMDLSSYAGVLAGADVVEEPPGVSILGESTPGAGDFDWSHSKLRARLRNNRMPPGWEFDVTEENRDGPTLDVNGAEVRAVDLIAAWVEAGVPETATFGDNDATFANNILPLFTEDSVWFEGSQACTGCHFSNSENSYHEMDLSSYEGILAGADVLEEPPGVSLLGESVSGAGDYDWGHSKLKERLRNNRMPPGWEFDITEENRDGPWVLHGMQ
ncbi:MAG: hypothetical protein GY805_39185, partial [Chloroflexi bacterium]|nr:hypothetical protein [Chloroflexota bacterium]